MKFNVSRKTLCVLSTFLVIFTFAHGAKFAEHSDPMMAESTKVNSAWQLLKESLKDQAPLLSSIRAEEARAKSSSNLRGHGQEGAAEVESSSMADVDQQTAESDSNDRMLAAMEASIMEAAATANANDAAVDAAAHGQRDPRPVTDTASEFEHDATDLMLGLGKSGIEATPMGDSVRQMKKLITETMLSKVRTAHSNNQNTLSRLAKELDNCGKLKQGQMQLAAKKESKYKEASPMHKACRAAEANFATERNACDSGLKSYMNIAKITCKSFAETKNTVASQVNNYGVIKKAAGEADETYVRRITTTFCGTGPGGKGGSGKRGHLDVFLTAKDKCDKATKKYQSKRKQCSDLEKKHRAKNAQCNTLQAQMDNAACTWAVGVKDACEQYVGCYTSKKSSYTTYAKVVKKEEKDRKAEWRGLKRMQCLIDAFADGKVSGSEVDSCKQKSHETSHLDIEYPKLPQLETCQVPRLYPATPAYKRAEFATLPSLARGQADANECTGVEEVSTTPAKGSPESCKCTRLTLMGSYSAGALIKCTGCKDVFRSNDANSCPRGTKLFSPRSRNDWQVVMDSAGPLKDPHFIVDITKPSNGCGGCKKTMNSRNGQVSAWETEDDSPWWLRSSGYKEPNGDYNANCYLNIGGGKDPDKMTFNDARCNYHSRSYYCQPKRINTKPKRGSPDSCQCTPVALTGKYSAGSLVKCENCWDTHRSRDKNSCPKGMKLFSPASRQDWKVVLASAGPLRAPNWIVDVTRPENGCGGCKKAPMKGSDRLQATWRTADGSPWWLRDTTYSEPSGDYYANCYLDLWKIPANENDITFNDGKCNYHSTSYYCQPVR